MGWGVFGYNFEKRQRWRVPSCSRRGVALFAGIALLSLTSPARGWERFVPEYDRHLDHVLIFIGRGRCVPNVDEGLRLFAKLPEYSRLTIVSPGAVVGTIHREIQQRGGSGVHLFRGGIEPWSQDWGELVGDRFWCGDAGTQFPGLMNVLGAVRLPDPLPLVGGNIQLARDQRGTRIVFIGSREYAEAVSRMATIGRSARQAYRDLFGADRVVILPNRESEHIDQMVMFAADGLAVTETMPRLTAGERRLVVQYLSERAGLPAGGEKRKVDLYGQHYLGESRIVTHPDRQQQSQGSPETTPSKWMPLGWADHFERYRDRYPHLHDLVQISEHHRHRRRLEAILSAQGFKIARLKTTVRHQLNCQHFVNGVVFRHRETQASTILLPVYPITDNSMRGRYENDLNDENVGILEAFGFQVIPVKSTFGKGGNLHCMINQLPPDKRDLDDLVGLEVARATERPKVITETMRP